MLYNVSKHHVTPLICIILCFYVPLKNKFGFKVVVLGLAE
jgi:hypothetical protein